MKGFTKLFSLLLVVAVLAVSCKDEKQAGTLAFDAPALFIAELDGAETIGFSAVNIKTYSITSKPTGWPDAQIDAAKQTITIIAPAEMKDGVAQSGSLILSGTSYDGLLTSATLFVGMAQKSDLSAKGKANSYMVKDKNKLYTFDAMHKGNGGSELATARVELLWQSTASMVQYVAFDKGVASFYIGASEDDKPKEGNALIAAYDQQDQLIWSWHIWATDYEATSVSMNGFQLMDRNLGALNNANSTPEEILASYGLYYQWGRKDPFIGPSNYQASNGASAVMYNAKGSRIKLQTAASSAETGTLDYAIQHPLTFITGVEASANDWLWSDHSDALWGVLKFDNDPCPFGWMVAPATAFAGLQIKEALNVGYETYANKYAWTLTKGDAESLFIGAGRRIYTNSTIQNIYNPLPARAALEAQPWVGYYWTSGAQSGTNSLALHFWFNKADVATSGVNAASPQARANGMQVRCVKQTFR
ncbi:MAG: hypothetical protein RR199_00275 [Alistipes sp.]